MINYISSFLNSNEINYFITLFKDGEVIFNDDRVYKYYFVNLKGKKLETDKFDNFNFKKFRVQKVNETINQVEHFHGHVNMWSFIIFLNETFEGGELVFENGNTYIPKSGDMIYFSGDERHKVNNSIGDRYTLIGFMNNNPLEIDNKKVI